MNSSLFRTLKFAALTAVFGTALMQAGQAAFHLPVTAHWGNAILQPGDYKVSLPDSSLGRPEFKIEGSGQTFYVFPLASDPHRTAKSGHLELKEINGEYFVRGFASEALSKEFTFYVPKPAHRQEAAKSKIKADSAAVSEN